MFLQLCDPGGFCIMLLIVSVHSLYTYTAIYPEYLIIFLLGKEMLLSSFAGKKLR